MLCSSILNSSATVKQGRSVAARLGAKKEKPEGLAYLPAELGLLLRIPCSNFYYTRVFLSSQVHLRRARQEMQKCVTSKH